ncbi:MAG: LemA family protein [Bacilli bacterium]|nr:LemA family protein [Bacilli bacterium]
MYMWIIILIVVVLVILYVISTYNGLVVARNKVKDQFSQIDVQLKRRFDLIPNLVETVKGYAKHESETLEKVIQARNNYANAKTDSEKIEASNEMSRGVMNIMALAENYPDLKANTNFVDLQNQLKDVEDKISYARQFYNDSVLMYNNKIEMFPSNLIASIFKFTKEAFFEAEEKERENVKVKF